MTSTLQLIQGAKKGGGSSRSPVEEKDSLRSNQWADVIDLVSEGEIQGLVNGLKSVYINKVPLQNADDSFNFEGVQFAWVPGTQGQAALPGFDAVQSETLVGVQVTVAAPVVRTITQSSTDTVRITIGVPTLTNQNPTNGDLTGSQFEYAVDVQSNGGGYVERYRQTVVGKTTTRYQRSIKLQLSGPAPWDIRVRRISAMSTSSAVQNNFFFDSYTEIQSVKLRYPNSALFALRVSAQQFNSVPTRSYDLLGLRIQVPTNYDPITRVYTGTWNGTFKTAWTNNPAWVFYALATTERWGLGEFVDAALIDKWALYAIGQYCDELVSDGRTGTEPRFTCNLVLQTREEAHKVLQDVAAIFRGMAFWQAGTLGFVQDAPRSASHLFAPGNVADGKFSYAGTSARQRHSVAIVYWNNPAEHFERVPEVVVDDALVAKLGIREIELSPLGVTSRGQANRVGRWLLYSEANESQTVSFRTSFEGAALTLGDVFKVTDPTEAGDRLGGRIKSATASAVTLDAPVTLVAGESYTLSVMWPDAAQPLGYITEERSVSTAAGVASTLTVAPAFSQAPAAQSMWLLASNTVQPTLWRCVALDEVEAGIYEVTGSAYDPGKFAAVEQGVKLEPRPISRLRERPVPPTGLTATETVYTAGAAAKSRVSVAWVPQAGGQTYRLSWRSNAGAWVNEPDTSGQQLDIDDVQPGPLEIVVRAVNAVGVSPGVNASLNVLGRTAMAAPSGLSIAMTPAGPELSWAEPTGAALAVWRESEVQAFVPGTGFVAIFRGKTNRHRLGWLAAGVNTWRVTHIDTAGNASVAAETALTVIAPSAATPAVMAEGNIARISWADFTNTQPIDYYELRRGVYSSSATVVAKLQATSVEVMEPLAGTWPYWIRAVDMGGNSSGFAAFDVVVSDRISTTLSTLGSGLAAAVTTLNSQGGAISTLTTNVIALQVSTATLFADTATLSATTAGQASAIVTLNNSVTTLSSGQSALVGTVNTLSATVTSQGSNIASLSASVSTLATAQAGVAARWGVRLDVNNRATGFILNAGTTQTDAVFLVDKFAIAYASQPDVYPFVVGMVNSLSTVGIDGNLMVDGTVFARSLNVSQLSAITANVGTLTAGVIRNAASTNVIDLNATGAANVVSFGSGKFTVSATGEVVADLIDIRRRVVVASGTLSAARTVVNGDSFNFLIATSVSDSAFANEAQSQPYGCWVRPIIDSVNYVSGVPSVGTWLFNFDCQPVISRRYVGIEGLTPGAESTVYISVICPPVGLNGAWINSLSITGWAWGVYRL